MQISSIKQMLMSTVDRRAKVHEMIDEVDTSFLEVVHVMLETYKKQQEDPIEGYDVYGNPLRTSELMDKYEKGLAEVETGNYITVEELREKTKEWLSNTK